MLTPYRIGQRIMISSVELGDALGVDHRKYYLFLRRYVENNLSLESAKDFFLLTKEQKRAKGKIKEFLLSTTVVKYILISERTHCALRIRRFVEDEIESGNLTPKFFPNAPLASV
jgi:phage anti-repressor protein